VKLDSDPAIVVIGAVLIAAVFGLEALFLRRRRAEDGNAHADAGVNGSSQDHQNEAEKQ
jgi:hypothetical protein